MNLHSLDFAHLQQSGQDLATLAAKTERRLLKRWLKHPVAQWGVKLENRLEALLRWFIQSFKTFEQGCLPRLADSLLLALAKLVKQDGLKLTILLTMLGYATWCINHL